ncbi:MAG: response regulator, partial [Candidatus Eisenbacteria bacterium]|nr:response regulator [Candidatus Eisenbacteria bacterium]
GMAPDVLARLFEPFMQADRTLDRTAGGLGLGLSLTKGIVELHGGAISARSAGPGQGSEFRIELPLERAASAQAPELCGPKIVRPRRVLVIEDNRDAAESLRLLLTIAGHEVAVAYDGVAGLRAAQDFRPDVVLCDVGLPLLDGYAVARAIRSDDTFRGTLLVALSGYALAEDLERAAEAGFDRHIAKPATFDKLEEILQGAEGRSDRRPEDGAP